MCDNFIFLNALSKNEAVPTQPCTLSRQTKVKFQRLLQEGSGEQISGHLCIFTRSQLAQGQLQAKSYQQCETVAEFELQEAEICNSFTFSNVLSKKWSGSNAAMYAVTPNKGEIPTTTAGGLWGTYLRTAVYFYKELASPRLAIS